MTSWFALFPLFTVYFLYHSTKRFRTRNGLLAVFCVASVFLGALSGALVPGLLYAFIFIAVGLLPVALRKEVRRAAEEHRYREHPVKEDVSKKKIEYEKWKEIRRKVVDEMERIQKRYTFAKTLVSQTEVKNVLHDLTTVFGSQKKVLGLAFSEGAAGNDGESGDWNPTFTSGWISEADWKILMKGSQFRMDSAAFQSVPPEYEFPFQSQGKDMVLVSAPVYWAGEVQGLLALLVDGTLPKDFLEEVAIYAQLLGLGLHKTYLYRIVVERSRRDGLTNLYLRRVFTERLNEEINISKRYGTSFSVLLLDLDHFKQINDTYGHIIGDKVLREVADCLKSTLHTGVTISRHGGEEFCVLIGLAPPTEVMEAAERIRDAIEALVLTFSDDSGVRSLKIGKRKGEIRITASIGVAHYLPDAPTREEIMRRADAALYMAKEANRNCVREWAEYN